MENIVGNPLVTAFIHLLLEQALVFTCLQYKSFGNTVGKGEIARNEQFLLFPQCFLGEVSDILVKFDMVVCKVFQFGRV